MSKGILTFVCLLCCLCVCNVCYLPNAYALDVDWVRVTRDNVNVYAATDSSKVMFWAEKSYYFQVLSETDDMYTVAVMQNQVDFPQISGCVWKSDVEICDKQPNLPYYPTVQLTVSGNSAPLKLSPVPSANTLVTLVNTQKVSYYGKIVSYGEIWFYVQYCGIFGYVTADNVTQPAISLHPTPLVQEVFKPTPPQEPAESTEPTKTTNTTEIFLIIFVGLLAVGVSLALFLPGNVKKQDVFDKEI